MELTADDLENLKRRGFLKEKEDNMFTLRTRMNAGNYKSIHFEEISYIAKKYGKGFAHVTTRQGIEVPFIHFDNIPVVEKRIRRAGILPGTSGPRLRPTTSCPGNNWCKRGLIDTFAFFQRIERELGFYCAMDLPHKFKIAISGCMNACTRVESSEIGLHGAVEMKDSKKRIGLKIYVGGCGGKTPHYGIKLKNIFTEDEALLLIKSVIEYFQKYAKPRQRLAMLIKEAGVENFFNAIGADPILK